MDSDTNGAVASDRPGVTDTGLRCPECEYNLTGLTDPRCPECGTTFVWDDIRRAAECPPRIAFERAKGWRKIPALLVTWATVLFAPWIFARQIVQRASSRHGLVFGAACFAGTSLSYLGDMDAHFQATWLLTALLYIPLQALWLSALDPAGWRNPLEAFRFWLVTGCYTSAVMLTEIVHGPPLLLLSDLWDFLTTGHADSWLGDIFDLGVDSGVWWIQLSLWILALCCIHARRVSRRPIGALVVVGAVVVGASLLVLYATAVQWIGALTSAWVGG